MSTNTKKKHGTGAAVVLIVLCLLALGTLGYIIWRQFNPVVPETAAGYVAAAGTTAPVYDENGTQLGSLVRGAEVQYVAEDAEDGADRVRVVNGEGYVLLDASHLADDLSRTVQVETVYALRGMSLLDETGKLCLDKAKLIVYSHGEYLALGKKLGTFGYTVRKKKPARKKK